MVWYLLLRAEFMLIFTGIGIGPMTETRADGRMVSFDPSLAPETTFPTLETSPTLECPPASDSTSHVFDATSGDNSGDLSYAHHDTSPDLDFLNSLHLDFDVGELDLNIPHAITPTLDQLSHSASDLAPSPLTASSPCDTPVVSRPKTGSTVQWYGRFHRHDNYAIDAATIEMISQRALTKLASLADSPDSTPIMYAKYVSFMLKLRPHDMVSTIMSLVMHLFFYIADGPDAFLWATRSQDTASPTYRKRPQSELFEALEGHLSPGASREFVANVKKWRKLGSRYAFLARRLGLGALVLAWVCSSPVSAPSPFSFLTLARSFYVQRGCGAAPEAMTTTAPPSVRYVISAMKSGFLRWHEHVGVKR